MIMSNVKYVDTSYDFIDNGEGELMLVMDAPEGTADDENAMFVFDGASQAMLVRNDGQIVRLPVIAQAVRDMLKDGREIILVTEMNGEEIADVYEARLDILNAPLPIPGEYNKPVTFTLEGGHTFEGDFNNEFTGKGKATAACGDIYEGDFVEGLLNGKGKKTFADGTVYEGDFVEGLFEGKGKYTDVEGSVYEGDFKADKMNGKGKLTSTNGNVYEGDLVDNEPCGKGKATFADGTVYEGDVSEGEPNGKGKMTYTNGGIYEGDFEDGLREGIGKMTYANGRIEEGSWIEDKYVKG
jgi:hypothetical protein